MWSEQINKVSSHFWLRHVQEKTFHAYLILKNGTHSVCGEAIPISCLDKMDIPGERSPCCHHCFSGLYGVDLRVTDGVEK